MLILQAGSAIAVRQNTKLIPIAVLILAVIMLFIILKYTVKAFNAFLRNSAAKKPKKVLDVNLLKATGKKLGLSKEEIAFLITLCKNYNITALPLISSTEQCIAGPLKTIYRNICAEEQRAAHTAETEAKKLLLFTIIHKIENGKRNLTMITNSIAFSAGLATTYTDEKGENYPVAIIENNDTEMIISIAQKKDGTKIKPLPLSKILLTIQLKNGIAYKISPRIIRYQRRKDFEEMVVTHTKNIIPMLQRRFKRVSISQRCTFRSLKILESEGKKQYYPQGQAYPGMINDISAGGCKMRTMVPAQDGQYIQITIDLIGKQIDSIIGIVVKSKKDVDMKTTVLHMRFIRMSKKARNTIFSLVYNYDEIV
ncbi:PilZ domain-containing protein [Treponema sp. OMZ 840]|uniref:PilZ domain-containing protein n=1 Tax=Treponema sp. OMZ 840 TaxID=244313 RepID=UPI003D8AB5AC